ncbi:MAG: FliA/WhiG family RNA polymerase sigma factor [Acidimicrobiia bacterium]
MERVASSARPGHPDAQAEGGALGAEELVVSSLPLVQFAVTEIWTRVPRHVSRDDLVSAAMMGLAQAARTFDPSRGVAFQHYASRRIKGALLDELRSLDWATRSVRAKSTQLRSVTETLTAALGRGPNASEIAEVMGTTVSDVCTLAENAHRATVLNYESIVTEGEAVDLLWVDDETPEDAVLRRERHAYLFDAVATLPERQKRVVVGYFFEERPMEELAQELGVTESRVSQLCSEALRKLRDGINSQLEPEALESTPDISGIVAKRRGAYYAAIAGASDYRTRLDASEEQQRARLMTAAEAGTSRPEPPTPAAL